MADIVRNHELADFLFSAPPFELGAMYVEDTDSMRFLKPNGTWEDIDETTLRKITLDTIINHSNRNPSVSMISDIVAIAKMRCEHRTATSAGWFVTFRDGSLNLKTWEIEPNDPVLRPSVIFIDANASEMLKDEVPLPPRLQNFLDTSLIVKDHPETPDRGLQAVLQEMFGLCLYPGNPAENAFFLYGEGSNGKSVACDLLMHMLGGRSKVSTLNLEQLTAERFYLAEIASKLANICREEQSKFVAAGAFRTIVSCEPVIAQRKFGHPFQFQPTLKLVFAVNRLPTMESGMDYSIRRRLILLPFFRKFGNHEKTENLARMIWSEDPSGVLAWALRGLKNLKDRKWDIRPERILSNAAINEEYLKGVSNSAEYILENYVVSDKDYMPLSMIYQLYKDWCSLNGYKNKSKRNFLSDLEALVPGAKQVFRRINGEVMRCRMLKLKTIDISESEVVDDKDPFDILIKEGDVDKTPEKA